MNLHKLQAIIYSVIPKDVLKTITKLHYFVQNIIEDTDINYFLLRRFLNIG